MESASCVNLRKTEIQPKFGRVLIKRNVMSKTSGGIILPDTAKKRNASCEGVIVAMGDTAGWTDTYDSNGEVRPIKSFDIGDKVIFGRHAGTWLDAKYDSKGDETEEGTLFICQDQDILAVIKE